MYTIASDADRGVQAFGVWSRGEASRRRGNQRVVQEPVPQPATATEARRKTHLLVTNLSSTSGFSMRLGGVKQARSAPPVWSSSHWTEPRMRPPPGSIILRQIKTRLVGVWRVTSRKLPSGVQSYDHRSERRVVASLSTPPLMVGGRLRDHPCRRGRLGTEQRSRQCRGALRDGGTRNR